MQQLLISLLSCQRLYVLHLKLPIISESSWTLAVIITFQGVKTQRNAGKTMILLLFLSIFIS